MKKALLIEKVEDKRKKLISTPFTYKVTKENKILISRNNKQIKIISGNQSGALLQIIATNEEEAIQLALAKITGHYKHGNEKKINM